MRKSLILFGAPGVTRTPGAEIRNLLLYPPELRGHEKQVPKMKGLRFCCAAGLPSKPQYCRTFALQHFLKMYLSMKHEGFKEFLLQGGGIRGASHLLPFAGKYSPSNFGHRS